MKLFERLQSECYIYPMVFHGEVSTDNAFSALYKAFEDYPVSLPPCTTCYPNAEELYRKFISIESNSDVDVSIIATFELSIMQLVRRH